MTKHAWRTHIFLLIGYHVMTSSHRTAPARCAGGAGATWPAVGAACASAHDTARTRAAARRTWAGYSRPRSDRSR